ncbi:protease pro-enzyme activation domain-containing protein [Rhodanobacter sp. FDAARGOS 1247]|uniref:protease pro-enzyme activation domain-containing protein n=1 Tax=Rhodanobacter sp. FDAARGOS 1247 TaxID=2778082 RepID=UPI001EF45F64|nr:protease pro-enzyme activation domain-containing protein [Rhodanobacter sp. FDAARGOS 1247]
MTNHAGLRGIAAPNYRKALLPAALALAMMSLSAHAADNWVATRTGPALLNTAAPAATASTLSAQASQATAPRYSLNMTGNPSLAGIMVSPLEASQPLHVAVSLKLRHADQLDQFLQQLNQPGSPEYHQYLTPAQFKARFAPTDAQVQAVVAHLQQSGFTNIEVAGNNQLITADGNALNVTSAFRTNMKRFEYRGRPHFANDSVASVPQALGNIVNAVVGLQNVVVKHTMFHKATLVTAQTQAASAVAHSPADFSAIYGGSSMPAATNTTVGVITWGKMTQVITDLGSFTSSAGLPTVNTQTVNVGSGTFWNDADSNVEWALDSQSIIGTSGGVQKLIFYAAVNGTNDGSLTDAGISAAYNKAVTDNVAKVVNISLGEDETAANSSGTLATDDQIFAQAAAQGQTFSASAGDEGAYESYGGDLYKHGTTTLLSGVSLSNYSVSEPAVSPNVIAVGGTTLSTNGAAWSGETVWNEGLSQDGNNTADDRLWATGGGVSKYETAPAWQTSALGSSITKRVLPDVAFDAAQSTGALIYANGNQYQVGGTSLASPIFVGAWARIQSANGNALGFPASKFYAAFPGNPSLLHDVTSGNNGYNGYGYNAAAGWDYTTGFGSFNMGAVSTYAQANWGGSTPPANNPPVASFGDTTSGLTASFTDSSTDSDGTIASHSWNFGDGGTSTAASPSHTYAAAGTYTVSLTVTDNDGASNTSTQSVTVTAAGGGGNVLQNGVALTGQAAATGAQLAYTVVIPAGATNLVIAESGGTGDADLYTKFGSAPTLSSYDCRPYVSGNSESCTVASPQAGTYYVMLNGYAAFSGVSIKATWSTGGGGNVLQNGTPVTGLQATKSNAVNYTMVVPAGASNLKFAISGGTGDADLYVKRGSAPTTSSYDCRPYVTGNSETCNISPATAGTYYVMVRAYSSYSGVTLTGSYTP